jgi:hypothetical protein
MSKRQWIQYVHAKSIDSSICLSAVFECLLCLSICDLCVYRSLSVAAYVSFCLLSVLPTYDLPVYVSTRLSCLPVLCPSVDRSLCPSVYWFINVWPSIYLTKDNLTQNSDWLRLHNRSSIFSIVRDLTLRGHVQPCCCLLSLTLARGGSFSEVQWSEREDHQVARSSCTSTPCRGAGTTLFVPVCHSTNYVAVHI